MGKIEKIIRSIYVAVAFSSAFAMHVAIYGSVLAAQVTQPQQYDMQSYLADRINHIETQDNELDARIRDLSDKVTTMEGIGEGSLAVLGILQLLGLIAKLHSKGDA